MKYEDLRRGILLVVWLYLLFWFVSAIGTVLFLFFAVLLLAMALNPLVTGLARYRIPRVASAGLLGVIVLAGALLLGWLVIPPIVDQAQQFVRDLPQYWQAAQTRAADLLSRFPFLRQRFAESGNLGHEALGYVTSVIQQAGKYTLSAASALFALFLVLILTVYTLASPRPLVEGFLAAVPTPYRGATRSSLVRIAGQMRAWVMASLILGAAVGFAAWLGLTLLGVPNALLLGVLAFLGEFIPNFGPIIAGTPAVLLGFAVSPTTALWVLLLYLAIQQLEAQLLFPLIMGGKMELHPLSIAFFVLVMGTLAGVVGALFAVPIAAIVKILYEEFYLNPRNLDRRAIERDADEVMAA